MMELEWDRTLVEVRALLFDAAFDSIDEQANNSQRGASGGMADEFTDLPITDVWSRLQAPEQQIHIAVANFGWGNPMLCINAGEC